MRFSLFTATFLILTLHLIIPVLLIVWTWRHKSASLTGFIVNTLLAASYFILIYIAGYWMFMSYYCRYLFPLLFVAAWIVSFGRSRDLPWSGRDGLISWIGSGVGIAISAVLIFLIIGAVRSYFYDEKPINLAFPLKHGVYAVFEGGNGRTSGMMNYHYGGATHKSAGVNRSMKYAVDITKVGILGNHAFGIFPRQNEKYAVFHEVVHSPCDGEVFSVVDEWPNETPGANKAPYNVGNYVAVRSGDWVVVMGHLQKGSIRFKKGDFVKTGQPLAQVGNSGWTLQPHIHIQAMKVTAGPMWAGEGIPIFFDGKNTVKNTLFFKD
jgi:hypothetical protein